MATKFIDEINRLFEELVHSPWQPLGLPPGESASTLPGHWQVDFPIRQADRGDVRITTEGRQLTVGVRRCRARRSTGASADVTTVAEDEFQQSFLVPEGQEISSLHVRFENERLRIRVELKKHRA